MGWLKPMKNESIESYAGRYREKITAADPVLLGYSFGGVIAIELSKQIPTRKVILISSTKTCADVPAYIRLAGKLRLYKLITLRRVLKMRALLPFLFEAKKEEEKNLVFDMLRKTDPDVFKWAVEIICTWKNTEATSNIVQVHGTDDRILPYHYVKCDYTIRDGSHLMILNRAQEISELLKKLTGDEFAEKKSGIRKIIG